MNLPKHNDITILKQDIKKVKIELFSIDIETKTGNKFSIDLNDSSSDVKKKLKGVFNN